MMIIAIASIISFLAGLAIGILVLNFTLPPNLIRNAVAKISFKRKIFSNEKIDQGTIDIYLSDIVDRIMELSHTVKSSVLSKDRTSKISNISIKIYNILIDDASNEEKRIINTIGYKEMTDYIYGVIDSNYEDIFGIEENQIYEQKRKSNINKLRKQNKKSQDLSSVLIDFYSDGEDI